MESIRDVIIIGAGVTGCSVARYLSRYQLDVLVLEKEEDVCSETSKANSAIVHAGFDAEPGTKKARFNVEGSQMMEALSKELDFDYKRNGSMVLCFSREDEPKLIELYERGIANKVEGLEIISGDEARKIEPSVSSEVTKALLAKSGAIVCPFGLTIAMAENAAANGTEFVFSESVVNITKDTDGIYTVKTQMNSYKARNIVNAAGVYADEIHNMICEEKLHITARKGDYKLLDKAAGNLVSHTIFQLPGKYGKGVLVTPTVHGNLLTGPTATDVDDKEMTATSAAELEDVSSKACLSVNGIPFRQVITSFSGLRAHEDGDDFVIGQAQDAEGFYDAAGIESPGLSSAPAIGKFLAEEIANRKGAEAKENWDAVRRGIPRPMEMDFEEKRAFIKENPLYGKIVCRCEMVSEGEIVEAIHRKPGAKSIDGIKRRTRAGMGRCQAGFCTPRTIEILSRELGINEADVCKNRQGSELIVGDEEESHE